MCTTAVTHVEEDGMNAARERWSETECVALSAANGGGLSAMVGAQFGRARHFLLVRGGPKGSMETLRNPRAMDGHGAGPATASLLNRHGVTAVLAGRFGPKALDVLSTSGISAFLVPLGMNGTDAFERLQAGTLERAGWTHADSRR